MSTRANRQLIWSVAALAVLASCSGPEEATPDQTAAIPVIKAELVASDGSWGNTEGPALDSAGALYFTSRGTYHGIVKWTESDGASQHAAVATSSGPGGLWIDAEDNIYLTATDEREIQRLSSAGVLTTVAVNFEEDAEGTTGPNDLTVSRAGTVYFTDPKGYEGEAAPGTIYRVAPSGDVSVFDDSVVGPNGILLSTDERTLYVAQNSAATTANLLRWKLDESGSATSGPELIASITPCVGDGMAVDANGNIWVTCYSVGTAHLIDKNSGEVIERVATEQQALTNAAFGVGEDRRTLYLTSSDLERVTGYVYRAKVTTPGP